MSLNQDQREHLDDRVGYLNGLRDVRWREEIRALERRIDRAETLLSSRTLSLTMLVGITLLLIAFNTLIGTI